MSEKTCPICGDARIGPKEPDMPMGEPVEMQETEAQLRGYAAKAHDNRDKQIAVLHVKIEHLLAEVKNLNEDLSFQYELKMRALADLDQARAQLDEARALPEKWRKPPAGVWILSADRRQCADELDAIINKGREAKLKEAGDE